MSKKCKEESKSVIENEIAVGDQNSKLSSVIGSSNVEKWEHLKTVFSYESDEEFVKYLLDVAEKHGARKSKAFLKQDKGALNAETQDTQKSETETNQNVELLRTDPSIPLKKPEISLPIPKEPTNENHSINKLLVPLNTKIKIPTIKKEANHEILNATAPKKSKIDRKLKPQNEVFENKIEKTENKRVSIKIKLCNYCGVRHVQDQCPIKDPKHIIKDSIDQRDWLEQYGEKFSEEENSFAHLSIPKEFYLEETDTSHGLGVYTKFDVMEFTQIGPLIGKIIKEVDVPEDCNMRDIYHINNGTNYVYFNTDDYNESNWIRFIRPAPIRDKRNLIAHEKNDLLYFVTISDVKSGEELLYWQDDIFSNSKKKMEKTTCGGCNMTFEHPLYYKVHCTIFHDIRYSLTIRKYHCKVCGVAVLGKENIMKHATELHNGQGAYQCQFCKKFFLRLNYLEMHRTYGCSANPHRSRPLCDFCGRKFCQPQKLKVHIKRMHSDLADVLKEFQCKNCFKILGSRAALQRHAKEVHQKQMEGACACSKCGKLFQNRSNLKIHMLTHSGIKPFKCAESGCSAAFTTKQCLQFHYKKVHSFTEDMMPKIERSVDYTFEAYSGGDDGDISEQLQNKTNYESNNSDQECSDNLNTVDDPPTVNMQLQDTSSNSNASPSILDVYNPSVKLLTKGSKKWMGRESPIEKVQEHPHNIEDTTYENTNLNTYRHESSNASLLVEAALDSVCSEPNIDIDVGTTTNCTDALVNNLYTLSQSDTLPDVTYNHSVDVGDSRDINLISPSVNDHISVTDDLNDELRHTQNIGMDYSNFPQEDFSPPNSPTRNNFVRDYINANSPQDPQDYESHTKNISPTASPPRYDFGSTINAESDDSNGIVAQNLSLHKDAIQLDLSIYKSHYNFDNTNIFRKDFRSKFEDENQENVESFEGIDGKHKVGELDLPTRTNLPDIRNKFELDLELRKSYDDEIRRTTYENSLDDFRLKNYDLESLEIRNKYSDGVIDDFRNERNFEPLALNPSELQGLDMSARSYHNYSNLNRYHHLYSEVERPGVELRLNYSPPPPSYTHADILRVVSLDLTPPGRHSVDLTLRSHQIANSRLLSEHSIQTTSHRLALDQGRLLSSDITTPRHLTADSRLISDMSSRILSDHTTNRILSNDPTNRLLSSDQRIINDETRILPEPTRLLDQSRVLSDGRLIPTASNGSMSPVTYTSYSVSPSPYHPTPLPPRPHASSPNPAAYHHYAPYF